MKARSLFPNYVKGFTLVEVMVAMVIGMIGIIIMMQVFATAEGQKRATTGTGDAQSSGAMALYELQRDIRQGGYGINSMSLLSCGLALDAPFPKVNLPTLGPAIINPAWLPAGDANTDTLLITFGNSGGSPEGDAIIGGSDVVPKVQTPKNFIKDDWVVGAPAADGNAACTLKLTLAQVTDVTGSEVTVNRASVAAAELLFNFGPTPTIRAYAIRLGNLTVCDYLLNDCSIAGNAGNQAIWVPIASNIVSLRAEYGHGANTWDQIAPTTACGWARTAALRIAVVARNTQVEQGEITAAAPTWEGSATAPLELKDTRANWKNYRYKVFETVVPIRNLPWMAKCP